MYLQSNNKIYEYVLDYTNSAIFVIPLHFTYINFREVDCLVDGFGQVVNARYNSLIIEKGEDNLFENIENNQLVNVYGIQCLYLDEDNNLVYRNLSKTKELEDHIFIENVGDILYTSINNNYANIITNNKIYKLDFKTFNIKSLFIKIRLFALNSALFLFFYRIC